MEIPRFVRVLFRLNKTIFIDYDRSIFNFLNNNTHGNIICNDIPSWDFKDSKLFLRVKLSEGLEQIMFKQLYYIQINLNENRLFVKSRNLDEMVYPLFIETNNITYKIIKLLPHFQETTLLLNFKKTDFLCQVVKYNKKIIKCRALVPIISIIEFGDLKYLISEMVYKININLRNKFDHMTILRPIFEVIKKHKIGLSVNFSQLVYYKQKICIYQYDLVSIEESIIYINEYTKLYKDMLYNILSRQEIINILK